MISDNIRQEVCILTLVYWPFIPGEGTRYPKVVCDLLTNRFKLTIITPYVGNLRKKTLSIEQSDNFKIVRVPYLRIKRRGFIWRILNNITFSFSCLSAWKFIHRNTLIFTVSPDPPYFVFVLPLLKRIKSLKHLALLTDMLPDVAFDVGIVKSSFLKNLVKWICVTAYKDSDHMSVITPSLKSKLVNYGVADKKISVIELAVDIQKFKPLEVNFSRLGLAHLQEKFIVMYSGSFGKMYDFDILLHSAQSIEAITDKIHFIIRGEGEQKDYIASRIKEMNLHNVTQLGLPPDPDSAVIFINLSSVCVVPIRNSKSIDMTHPSKIIEFWACKKPVICTSTGEVSKLIARANAGFAINPRDQNAMTDTILKLHADRDLLNKMGENARAFVVSEFSYEKIEKKLSDLIFALNNSQT